MRKFILTLVALLASAGLSATQIGQVGRTDLGQGSYIGLGKPAVTPNATPGTSIPKNVVVTKILLSPATAGTAATFALWDSPTGLTYGAGARKMYDGVLGTTVNANVLEVNFTTSGSSASQEDGLIFKGFPTWVNSSANTVNATIMWRPWTGPVVR